MMTNGNIFRVTGPLWGELTGHRWIPLTKASGAELWCFLWSALSKGMSKQSRHRWFETPSRPLWRHCNDDKYINTLGSLVFGHYRSCCWYQLNTLSCFDLHVLVIIRRPHRESDRIKLNDSHSVNNQFNSAANHRPFVKCLWIKKNQDERSPSKVRNYYLAAIMGIKLNSVDGIQLSYWSGRDIVFMVWRTNFCGWLLL